MDAKEIVVKICKCGFPKDNHHFVHPFEEVVDVCYTPDYSVVDLSKLESIKGERCGYSQCNFSKLLHGKEAVCEKWESIGGNRKMHEYVPETFSYKKFTYALPPISVCKICKKNILKHNNIERYSSNDDGCYSNHVFTTDISFLGRQKEDKISVVHPEDDDNKIAF